MKELLALYEKELGIKPEWYGALKSLARTDPNEYIQIPSFLQSVSISGSHQSFDQAVPCKQGDQRIDMPIMFGNLNDSKLRVMIVALEPRATNDAFHLKRVNNRVYATIFGAERWNNNSSLKQKLQNRYLRAFSELITDQQVFTHITDAVKSYTIVNPASPDINDKYARDNFMELSEEWKPTLKMEIDEIDPHIILACGDDAFEALNSMLGGRRIKKLRHPSHGDVKLFKMTHPAWRFGPGARIAKEQIRKLILQHLL